MSTQCEALQNECGSRSSISSRWLRDKTASIASFYSQWVHQRQIKKSRRVLESLPENILNDIGWPSVEDRIPGIPKKTKQ